MLKHRPFPISLPTPPNQIHSTLALVYHSYNDNMYIEVMTPPLWNVMKSFTNDNFNVGSYYCYYQNYMEPYNNYQQPILIKGEVHSAVDSNIISTLLITIAHDNPILYPLALMNDYFMDHTSMTIFSIDMLEQIMFIHNFSNQSILPN